MIAEPAPTDRCPRCGGVFACGAAGPGPCACTGVALGAAMQARLRDTWTGCLCLRCLQTLAQDAAAGAAPTASAT